MLKHQFKKTHCLFPRDISILVNPRPFLNAGFRSLNTEVAHNYRKVNHFESIDSDLMLQFPLGSHRSTYSSYDLNKLISLCATSRSLGTGSQVHSFVLKMGFCSHVYISTALVNMYGKCGEVSDAQILFDEMPHTNVITWNSLISGYLHTEYVDILVELFVTMLRLGIQPTHFTVSTVLVGCSQLESLEFGRQIHGMSKKSGFLANIVVGTALLEMYWKCSDVNSSRRIFDELPDKNVITWTSMITGYTQYQQTADAMYMIREMLSLCGKANSLTYNILLSSFCKPKDLIHCKQIHSRIIKEGLESDIYLAVTLVTVYSQCDSSSLQDFHTICSTIPILNNISCNAIIAGFSNLGCCKEALTCFSEMRQAGICIDSFTLASILKVIGVISALEEGQQAHGLAVKSAFDSNIYIQNGLLSMYAKCGKIDKARSVFLSMADPDTISWNALLSGYAQHGYGGEVVELFEKMTKTKVKPDLTTYLIVLSACSHVGFIDKGLEYFESMRNNSSVEPPKVEHYACIVDLYARAGYLDEAEEFIDRIPMKAKASVYKTLLSACWVYNNKETALRVTRKFVDLFPEDPAVYVQLSRTLAIDGYWDDSAHAHELMRSRGIKKKAGCSWI